MSFVATTMEHVKNVGIGLGVLTAVGSMYAAVGLPMPATVGFVNAKVEQVDTSIKSLSQIVLEGQIRQNVIQRQLLRNEKTGLEQTEAKPGTTTALAIRGRLAQIEDRLRELDGTDESLRHQIETLKARSAPKA